MLQRPSPVPVTFPQHPNLFALPARSQGVALSKRQLDVPIDQGIADEGK